jgi:hypothetical protein
VFLFCFVKECNSLHSNEISTLEGKDETAGWSLENFRRYLGLLTFDVLLASNLLGELLEFLELSPQSLQKCLALPWVPPFMLAE